MNKMQCSKCGGIFSDGFFEINYRIKPEPINLNQTILFEDSKDRMRTLKRRKICIGCRSCESDEEKAKDRSIEKAKDCFQSHCRRLHDFDEHGQRLLEPGINPERLRDFYGWEIDRIAHLFRHGYENTCTYCYVSYAAMGHGLRDITLDIINREIPPFIRTNVAHCCNTCNTAKGQLSPIEWEQRLLDWKTWRVVRQKLYPSDSQPMLI